MRQFGFILSGILFGLGGLALVRKHAHVWFEWPLSLAVLILTLAFPRILAHIYRTWMLAAEGVSWILLRVILGILFYGVISPMALIMRAFGTDFLDERLDPAAASYWAKRPRAPMAPEHYERLF